MTARRGEIVVGRHVRGRVTLDADVVIVGSGAGGATVADALTRAGKRVVVLEEGPYVPPEAHAAMRPSESLRHVWRDGGMTFAVGLGDSPFVNVTMGRGVGGSSAVTGGVCFRTPGEVLDDWSRRLGLEELSEEGLAPHFDAVERMIHVETVPPEMRSGSTVRFGEGLRALTGRELLPIRRNTRGCEGEGVCNFGCPHGHKLSVDRALLPAAVARGAVLVSDCLVDRVLFRGRRAVGVRGHLAGGGRRRVTVRAGRVVVATGAWHGPLLLGRSGIRHRMLGKKLTLHPSFRVAARFDEPVRGWAGALQSAWSDAFMREGITLISVFVPPAVVAAAIPGVGPEHARRAADIDHVAMFGALVHDEGGGRVRRGLGREPLVTFRMGRGERAAMPRAVRIAAEIFFAAGAREAYLPVIGLPPVRPGELAGLRLESLPGRAFECTSQHPLGTATMGVDPRTSVVDPDGRVRDVDGLWVADGAIVPTSLGVNPQLTVMAMALRVASKMLG
ncbi:MAG: GMC family oxidoreductase [Myxococcales bacterium]|nr:GMC family oxidoreductase [Myxococcales bacterium]